ncbi:hypothetical protein KSP39_PZI004524 [Platanthera zijinensis]|uniref:Uncharacterized protein n=1 Tax=Platanthera zijinensis TaxID=2320716 RepID=A0AAP0GC53_9ASPA
MLTLSQSSPSISRRITDLFLLRGCPDEQDSGSGFVPNGEGELPDILGLVGDHRRLRRPLHRTSDLRLREHALKGFRSAPDPLPPEPEEEPVLEQRKLCSIETNEAETEEGKELVEVMWPPVPPPPPELGEVVRSLNLQAGNLAGDEADWEKALVESTGENRGKKQGMAGDFNMLALDGMYDDHGTPASGFADGSSDPFAALAAVPPPPWVQMSEMERKRHQLVEEQLRWQYCAREGRQGNFPSAFYPMGAYQQWL